MSLVVFVHECYVFEFHYYYSILNLIYFNYKKCTNIFLGKFLHFIFEKKNLKEEKSKIGSVCSLQECKNGRSVSNSKKDGTKAHEKAQKVVFVSEKLFVRMTSFETVDGLTHKCNHVDDDRKNTNTTLSSLRFFYYLLNFYPVGFGLFFDDLNL